MYGTRVSEPNYQLLQVGETIALDWQQLSNTGYEQIAKVASLHEAQQQLSRQHADLLLIDCSILNARERPLLLQIQHRFSVAVILCSEDTKLQSCMDREDAAVGIHAVITTPCSIPLFTATATTALQQLRINALLKQQVDGLMHLNEQIVSVDPITGLPNHDHFGKLLAKALSAVSQIPDHEVVLFAIHVGHHERVRDALGPVAGDLLLSAVANRLRSGCSEATISRIDERWFLLFYQMHTHRIDERVSGIINCFEQPLQFAQRTLQLTPRIGVAVAESDLKEGVELIGEAKHAARTLRSGQGRSWQRYQGGWRGHSGARFELELALQGALERNEFKLLYQPQFKLDSRQIIGVEVLLRWDRPGYGILAPDQFLSLLEEDGLIVPVGAWILRHACGAAYTWQQTGTPIRVSINLSVAQLESVDILPTVAAVLQETGVDPHRIELELTESLLIRDLQESLGVLNALHRLGVRLAIDDFGTGYSSLSYLQKFPLDTLKVDMQFVRELHHHKSDGTLVKGILSLAHSLGYETVAEGIEHESQAEFLAAAGCVLGQGYLVSPPVAMQEITQMLHDPKILS